MKSILLITSFLTFCSAVHTWQEFQSYEGRFQISVPGELTHAADTLTTAIGETVHHTYYLQAENEEEAVLFYSIIYYDLPEQSINSDSTELVKEFFDNTTEAAARSVRGELLYQNYEELSGFPGYFWRIDYLDGKAVIKSKAWLADNRYYELKTISWKEKNVNADADRFFDSFKLIAKGN